MAITIAGSRRRGISVMTILAVLLVVAALLLALLLPKTQSAGRAARRIAEQADRRYQELGAANVVYRSGRSTALPADAAISAASAESARDTGTPIIRKIIYTAEIDLAVADFSQVEESLPKLVKEHGGYIAKAEVVGTPGTPRSGTWKARIPVDRFELFRAAVQKLGELQKNAVNADDISEEFYDLEARVKNKKVEEKRLLKHLEESTAKLKDTLDVERELSRVREEIERQEGRLRLLANLSAMTTVTVSVRSLGDYTPASEPSFATSLTRAFRGSLDRLLDFGKVLAIAIVTIVPWLPLVAAGGWFFWKLARRIERRLTSHVVSTAPLTNP